jgi:predicted secreted protein
MGVFEGVVVYVVLFWLVLLPILSMGQTSQIDAGEVTPGTEPSAPVKARLPLKIAIAAGAAGAATLVAALVLNMPPQAGG